MHSWPGLGWPHLGLSAPDSFTQGLHPTSNPLSTTGPVLGILLWMEVDREQSHLIMIARGLWGRGLSSLVGGEMVKEGCPGEVG